MINEQKAKELCGACPNCTFSCGDRLNCKVEDKYNIAMKMAEWKEQQIIYWLKNKAANYVVCEEAEFSHYAIKSMIEDLKKAMKEE